MSRDWESTLTSWAKRASDTEEAKRDRTAKAITDALNADPAVKDLPINVYPKGSYANRTNVRADSDVDINVEYTGIFFYELTHELEGKSGADIGIEPASGTDPDPVEFKNLIENALVKEFGRGAVERQNKAIELQEQSNRLAADVVPCYTHHRYERQTLLANPTPLVGTQIFPDSGGEIINWPKQHYENGVAKNTATRRCYKAMVRCLKRLENEMVEKGVTKEVPSYLIECLVYNVPNNNFRHATYYEDFGAVIAHIYNETLTQDHCSEWVEVNELKYLFGSHQKWTRQEANKFAWDAWNYVGFE